MDQKIITNVLCKNYETKRIDEEYRIANKKFLELIYFQYINKTNSEHLLKLSFYEFLNLPQMVSKGIFNALVKQDRENYLTFDEFVEGVSLLFDKYLPKDNKLLIGLLFRIFRFNEVDDCNQIDLEDYSKNNDLHRNYTKGIYCEKENYLELNVNNIFREPKQNLNSNDKLTSSNRTKNENKNLNKSFKKMKELTFMTPKSIDITKLKNHFSNKSIIQNSNECTKVPDDEEEEKQIKRESIIRIKYLQIFLNNLILKLFLLSKNNRYYDFMSVCEELKLVIKKTFGAKSEISLKDFESALEAENELYFIIIHLFYCVSPINENILDLIINNKNSEFLKDEANLCEEDFEDIMKINTIRQCNVKKSLFEVENDSVKVENKFMKIDNNNNNTQEESFWRLVKNNNNLNVKQKEIKNYNNNSELHYYNFKNLNELDLIKLNLKVEANKFERKFILENQSSKDPNRTVSAVPTCNLNNSMNNSEFIFILNNDKGNKNNALSPILKPIKKSVNNQNNNIKKDNYQTSNMKYMFIDNPTLLSHLNSNCSSNNLIDLRSNNKHNLTIDKNDVLAKNYSADNLINSFDLISNNSPFAANKRIINFSNLPYNEISNNNFYTSCSINSNLSSMNFNSNKNLNSVLNKNAGSGSIGSSNINKNSSSMMSLSNNIYNIKNDWIVKIIKNITETIEEKKKKINRSSYFAIYFENELLKEENETDNKLNHSIFNEEYMRFLDNNDKEYKRFSSFRILNNNNKNNNNHNSNSLRLKEKNDNTVNYYPSSNNSISDFSREGSRSENYEYSTRNNINNNKDGKSKFFNDNNSISNNSNIKNFSNQKFEKEKTANDEKKKKHKRSYELFDTEQYSKYLGDLLGEFLIIFSYKNLGKLGLKEIINLKFSIIETEEEFLINGNFLYPVLINQIQISYRIFFENESEREIFIRIYQKNIQKEEILKNYKIESTLHKNKFSTTCKGVNKKTKNKVEIKTYFKSAIKKESLLLELLEQKDLGHILSFFKNADFPKIKYFENLENIYLVFENYQENPLLFFFMNPKSKISKDITKYSKILVEMKMYKKLVKLVKYDENEYSAKRNKMKAEENNFCEINVESDFKFDKIFETGHLENVHWNKISKNDEIRSKFNLLK